MAQGCQRTGQDASWMGVSAEQQILFGVPEPQTRHGTRRTGKLPLTWNASGTRLRARTAPDPCAGRASSALAPRGRVLGAGHYSLRTAHSRSRWTQLVTLREGRHGAIRGSPKAVTLRYGGTGPADRYSACWRTNAQPLSGQQGASLASPCSTPPPAEGAGSRAGGSVGGTLPL